MKGSAALTRAEREAAATASPELLAAGNQICSVLVCSILSVARQ